jgi:hypothetical protein
LTVSPTKHPDLNDKLMAGTLPADPTVGARPMSPAAEHYAAIQAELAACAELMASHKVTVEYVRKRLRAAFTAPTPEGHMVWRAAP